MQRSARPKGGTAPAPAAPPGVGTDLTPQPPDQRRRTDTTSPRHASPFVIKGQMYGRFATSVSAQQVITSTGAAPEDGAKSLL